jgi:hypothetical protein
MKEAVRGFILANAIRDLRGEGATHRSMLVNVTRFTDVQSRVADVLSSHLRTLQQDIRNYAKLPVKEAMKNASIASIHGTWQNQFKDVSPPWGTLQGALVAASLPITVKAVNQKTGAASLDYSTHKNTGLRVIAVGGNSLSRGLTLEGLSESYFYRNSQMYDTLLQMGRWFGYRDGFSDLCRVSLTVEAQHWYAHIVVATVELRAELRKMRSFHMTPQDFGLKVRAHPDGLIVTARNKMRSAKTVERVISVSNQYLETPRLWTREKIVEANSRAVEEFLKQLTAADLTKEKAAYGEGILWKKVPRELIISLLRSFNAHPHNITFQVDDLANYLEGTDDQKLEWWDVVLPSGRAKAIALPGGTVAMPQERAVERGTADDMLVSGKSARVASRGAEREGMDISDVSAAEADFFRENPDKKNAPDHAYRARRRRPLLMLHLLIPFDDEKRKPIVYEGANVWALGLSFPDLGDEKSKRRVTYKINLVEWRNLFEAEEDDDTEVVDDSAIG